MEIELDPTKNAQENAALYFEKAKKLRKKAEGAREAIASFAKKFEEEEVKEKKKRKKKKTRSSLASGTLRRKRRF